MRQNQPAVPFAGEGFLIEKNEEFASKIKTTLLSCKNIYCWLWDVPSVVERKSIAGLTHSPRCSPPVGYALL
jgi:hypothetical protein